MQTLLSYPLRKDGYEVVQASDGREALARFDEAPFDLVVLDVMMPRLDGLEVCRRLRARSSVPIIMLTAKAEEIDKVLGLELGADDYITKPFSLREFRSRVKAALRRASMARRDAGADEEPLEVHELRIDLAKRTVRVRGERGRRRRSSSSRSSPRWPRSPGPRLDARHAADADLGRQRLPRPAHDRRPHPPPAREARARREGPGVPLHRARRRLPVPRHGRAGLLPALAHQPPRAARLRASRSRRSPVVWLGVVPASRRSMREQKLDALAAAARAYSRPITDALDRSARPPALDALVRRAADASARA